MNVMDINRRLAVGISPDDALLPHVEDLKTVPYRFDVDFGFPRLPTEGGVIAVRGARQYGKSTWLELHVLDTVKEFGPGTAYYLNGDLLTDADALDRAIRDLLPLFRRDAPVRRVFIDEITAVKDWQRALKRLADGRDLRGVLVVTTGSKAADLRHGVERMPGRKGRLHRTSYLFAPIPFAEFRRKCGPALGSDTVDAYLLTGGSPIACAHIAQGRLPEHVVEIMKDWVYGAFAASGRGRVSLLAVMECLIRFGGSPLGQAKLAREAGLANNTVAADYLELLMDLTCVTTSLAWDPSRRIRLRRKPSKVHFANTFAALAWHPGVVRTPAEFRALPAGARAAWHEWAVAQELWRRAAIRGDDMPEEQSHWRSDDHELDFVLGPDEFLEVKLGPTNPLEFAWFGRVFPKARLTVVSQSIYETRNIRGVRLEEFLAG